MVELSLHYFFKYIFNKIYQKVTSVQSQVYYSLRTNKTETTIHINFFYEFLMSIVLCLFNCFLRQSHVAVLEDVKEYQLINEISNMCAKDK